MSGKKVCLNSPSSYYTGREQSPLHYGLSAEGYEINAIMEGYDKELWIVEVRNNKKVWTKKEYINKMTYEIPLIKELPDTFNDTSAGTTIDTSVGTTIDTSAGASTCTSTGTSAGTSKETTDTADDSVDIGNKESKVSKTMKPTDYTLFITYRIHQMKMESGDNKKSYDCAREEWKEYKKKPEELRVIMVEATNFQKTNTSSKINKK